MKSLRPLCFSSSSCSPARRPTTRPAAWWRDLRNLQELCGGVGGRLTGSPAASKAIEWAAGKFRATAGCPNVANVPRQGDHPGSETERTSRDSSARITRLGAAPAWRTGEAPSSSACPARLWFPDGRPRAFAGWLTSDHVVSALSGGNLRPRRRLRRPHHARRLSEFEAVGAVKC